MNCLIQGNSDFAKRNEKNLNDIYGNPVYDVDSFPYDRKDGTIAIIIGCSHDSYVHHDFKKITKLIKFAVNSASKTKEKYPNWKCQVQVIISWIGEELENEKRIFNRIKSDIMLKIKKKSEDSEERKKFHYNEMDTRAYTDKYIRKIKKEIKKEKWELFCWASYLRLKLDEMFREKIRLSTLIIPIHKLPVQESNEYKICEKIFKLQNKLSYDIDNKDKYLLNKAICYCSSENIEFKKLFEKLHNPYLEYHVAKINFLYPNEWIGSDIQKEAFGMARDIIEITNTRIETPNLIDKKKLKDFKKYVTKYEDQINCLKKQRKYELIENKRNLFSKNPDIDNNLKKAYWVYGTWNKPKLPYQGFDLEQ